MSDTDGRRAREDASTPPVGLGRFADGRPQWPSLRGDAGSPGDAGPAGAGGVPSQATGPVDAPVPAASAEPPSRRSRRYDAADDAAAPGPVDPAERTAALARADAALQAGEAQARTSALARAEAALAAAGAPEDRPGTEGAGADDGAAGATPDRGRRRWVLIGAVAAVVLVLGGAGTAWFLTRDEGGTAAAPPDVVLPSPTATASPAARTATTAFASTLPTTLLQYALASSADDEAWLAANAVEAYAETYTDGADGTVTVQAGQWETPEEAAAALAAVTAALPTAAADGESGADGGAAADPSASADPSAAAGGPSVLLQGEVLVGDAPVGTVTVVDAGDGTGVAAWSNGTTVFRVQGPAADIRNLYAAYPL